MIDRTISDACAGVSRRKFGRDEQVGTVVLDHLLQKVLRQSYCLIAFHVLGSPFERRRRS